MYNYFCFVDSKYASISDFFHKSRPAGRYGLGKPGRFFKATKVCFVMRNNSRTSGPVKYFSSSILFLTLLCREIQNRPFRNILQPLLIKLKIVKNS